MTITVYDNLDTVAVAAVAAAAAAIDDKGDDDDDDDDISTASVNPNEVSVSVSDRINTLEGVTAGVRQVRISGVEIAVSWRTHIQTDAKVKILHMIQLVKYEVSDKVSVSPYQPRYLISIE